MRLVSGGIPSGMTLLLREERPLAFVEASFLLHWGLLTLFFRAFILKTLNRERSWELVPTHYVVLGFNFPSSFHGLY